MLIHAVASLNTWPDKQLTDKIQVAKRFLRRALSRRPLWWESSKMKYVWFKFSKSYK